MVSFHCSPCWPSHVPSNDRHTLPQLFAHTYLYIQVMFLPKQSHIQVVISLFQEHSVSLCQTTYMELDYLRQCYIHLSSMQPLFQHHQHNSNSEIIIPMKETEQKGIVSSRKYINLLHTCRGLDWSEQCHCQLSAKPTSTQSSHSAVPSVCCPKTNHSIRNQLQARDENHFHQHDSSEL